MSAALVYQQVGLQVPPTAPPTVCSSKRKVAKKKKATKNPSTVKLSKTAVNANGNVNDVTQPVLPDKELEECSVFSETHNVKDCTVEVGLTRHECITSEKGPTSEKDPSTEVTFAAAVDGNTLTESFAAEDSTTAVVEEPSFGTVVYISPSQYMQSQDKHVEHVTCMLTNESSSSTLAANGNTSDHIGDSSVRLECNYGAGSPCSTVEVEEFNVSAINVAPSSLTPAKKTDSVKRKLKRKPKVCTDGKGVKKQKVSTGCKKVKKTKNCQLSDNIFVLDQLVDNMSNCGFSNSLNAKEEATQLFQWLIHPVKSSQFFNELWEKKPLLIKRHNRSYNDGWFSSEDLTQILENNPVQFGTHLDLTSYRGGKRETHNKGGRAFPELVWRHFKEGGSVRMLNPQTYSEPVWRLLNTLQDYFRSTMGANIYLTPPGTQGFAPHYDDIEAFLIQLEGKKHWRLYAPRSDEETLPIHSSGNFGEKELGKLILDTTLEAGDMLYFPRGTVHQGNCLPDSHSLHVTISTYQLNSWGDFLEKLLPKALTIARQEDLEYRAGLPRDFLDYTGISKSDVDSPNRGPFVEKIETLLKKLVDYAPIDAAADDMAARLLHEALPPNSNRSSVLERGSGAVNGAVNGAGSGGAVTTTDEQCGGVSKLPERVTEITRVRLVTPYAARLLAHEDCVSLQHSSSNTRIFHEIERQEIDYVTEFGPALEMLTNTYPHFLEVKALPLEVSASIELVQELIDMNILQQKPGAPKKSPIIAAIKARVNRPPAKIKSKSRKDSAEEIVVNLRNNPTHRSKKSSSRPSSEVFDQFKTGEMLYRKSRTLER